jgi:transposase InsO family protein
MRLMRYSYQVIYTAGKNLTAADSLSRAPTGTPEKADLQLETDARVFVQSVIDGLPASTGRLLEIKAKQQADQVCRQIMEYCRFGWPDKSKINHQVRQYYPIRDDLTVEEGLLLYGTRLVIPEEMRKEILEKLHDGHQGIVKCRAMAKCSVWWPGVSQQVQSMVENCGTCEKERKNRPEPLKPSKVPDYPWQTVGMDLFEWEGQEYLLVVDYFSRNIELAHLRSSTTSETVINHFKSIFARHGIPEIVHSDNGPQFASRAFEKFADKYGFTHETSSPHHHEGNGEAERAVATVKNFLAKAEDPYLALLQYRATPLQNGYSPAEMSMGRRLRTRVPVFPTSLVPVWPALADMKAASAAQKEVQKKNFDRRHKVVQLPVLKPGDPVWVKEPREERAEILRPVGPRSYVVQTPKGKLRRNRRHLNRRLDALLRDDMTQKFHTALTELALVIQRNACFL